MITQELKKIIPPAEIILTKESMPQNQYYLALIYGFFYYLIKNIAITVFLGFILLFLLLRDFQSIFIYCLFLVIFYLIRYFHILSDEKNRLMIKSMQKLPILKIHDAGIDIMTYSGWPYFFSFEKFKGFYSIQLNTEKRNELLISGELDCPRIIINLSDKKILEKILQT